jgi:DNA-binding transcriptional LysR family regulator
MLDSRRLQVLSAVVNTGSITAAANVLGYTASAVSQNIAALERETRTVLFEKAGRGVRPTQAGRLLAEHADGILDRLRDAEAALKALASGEAGRLRLAAFSTAGASLVPRAMAKFRAAHRAVQLDLTVAEDDEALAALRAGNIDLAVIVVDGDPLPDIDDDLARTAVLVDPYRVILPRDHTLAGRRTVPLKDLADDAWIATAAARCNARAVVTTACEDAGFTPHFAIEAEEFSTVVGFVGEGLGVALVPLLALGSTPETVRVRTLRGDEPVRYVYAVTRRSNADDPLVTGMVEALRTSAQSSVSAAA